ncbi:hydrogenase maturation protease [Clostridium cylindrosporum]|uniref:Hydrogenase maturation protease n=1 Tax=Clostridium cylindrosporum DSM 605 TaxID=1121307 RepID=A0A0J8D852_CLOCY|nr:hydrogenase maturation protease [Clostridium cylindrosporum]KMT22240.1 hydrogenase maturation protease [Clostridium cylindrosporum DSM 605]
MIKIFGIGNILLSDDAIGVRIVESIIEKGKDLGDNVKVIVGETDYMYCLDQIEDGDMVIIIDSTYFNIAPGIVTKLSFEECDDFLDGAFTQHEESLLKVLRSEYRHIKGYLIGVEIDNLDFGIELSSTLQENFDFICREVCKAIKVILKER